MRRTIDLGYGLPEVCRLGMSTRGNTRPTCDDVLFALDQGINYWNWCGHEDGMSEAMRQLGDRRRDVVFATQLRSPSWTRHEMRCEIELALSTLETDYLDIVTLYYVESESEWEQIEARDGAIAALRDAKREGIIRCIGLTTHQRPLAARWARSKELDLLMVRYNAAHRGAEREVFPVTDSLGLPVVCFTCMRWGKLLNPTPDDPDDFRLPDAGECYRFVLSNPSVSVALMAPLDGHQLRENLKLLDDWRSLPPDRINELMQFGDRVRQTAGPFP